MTVKEFPLLQLSEVTQQYLSVKRIPRYGLMNLADPFLLKKIWPK